MELHNLTDEELCRMLVDHNLPIVRLLRGRLETQLNVNPLEEVGEIADAARIKILKSVPGIFALGIKDISENTTLSTDDDSMILAVLSDLQDNINDLVAEVFEDEFGI